MMRDTHEELPTSGWSAAVVQADGLADFVSEVEDHLDERELLNACGDE